MNKPNRNENADLITVQMAMARTNLCKKAVIDLAKEAKAYVKFGKSVRIIGDKLMDHIENMAEQN